MKKSSLSIAIASILSSQMLLAETLPPVVVTPNNLQQPEETVTSITHVITREEIEENGWETVAEALNSLPNISISSNGGLGTATSVYLRGQNGNGILFLIDGEMIADAAGTTLAPQIENLLLDNVERIEVVEGPQSGVWGANASGGVINIITRQAGQNSVSITAGSNNTRQISTFVSKKSKMLTLSAHLSSLSTEGYSALKPYEGSDSGLEKDGFSQDSLGFKARITPVQHHAFEVKVDNTQATASFDSTSDPNSTADYNERRFLNKSLRYFYQEKHLQGKLSLSEYVTDRTSYSAFGSTPFKSNLTTFNGQVSYQYHPKNTLQFAAGNQRIQGNNEAYWHDYVGLTHVHTFDKLSLTEAIRYDHYDRFKDASTGKVGFKYPFSKNLSIQANYGTGYNAPSAYQIGGLTENLKPESTEGWDSSLQWKTINISYFYQTTKNLIQYNSGFDSTLTYVNLKDKSTFKGWSIGYKNNFSYFNIQLNYDWLEAYNPYIGNLTHRAFQKGTLRLNYLGFNRWDVNTTIKYVGDLYDAKYDSQKNLYVPSYNIGNYTTMDIAATYYITKHFHIFLKAINLFDTDYYQAADGNTPPSYGYNTGGFQWRIGLRGSF